MAKATKKTGAAVALTGAALAMAAAAAAGAYFLYGKDGAKNRKKVKGWAVKAKGEILERLEGMGDMSQDLYDQVLSEAEKRYSALSHVDKKELAQMIKELRGHWKSISRHISPAKKKAAKKAAKKARR